MDGDFDKKLDDFGVSGAPMDAKHPDFASLLDFVRRSNMLPTYGVDRLGRDALDVQSSVLPLLGKGVAVHVRAWVVLSRLTRPGWPGWPR